MKKWPNQLVPIDQISPLPQNERYISSKNLEGLKQSMRRWGVVEIPIWNKTTGHLVGGHQRFYALKEEGFKEIWVKVVEMDESEEVAAALTMNNRHIEGEWAPETADLLRSLEAGDSDLYRRLNMESLQKEVDKLAPKMPEIQQDPGFRIPDPEFNISCPCCGNKWMIESKDVVIEDPNLKEKKGRENEAVKS